jgi:hypothetical protein
VVIRYLIDTSVWVNIFRGDLESKERLAQCTSNGNSILMCEPIAMELIAGARKHEISQIMVLIDSLASEPFDSLQDFRSAGVIRRELAWSGISVKSVVDCMIAATAMGAIDIVVVHNDSDFEQIASKFELRQERWNLVA